MATRKLSQLSSDFNIKTKDLSDEFKKIGMEKKSSTASVSDEDYEVFLSFITSARQIKDMAAYKNGTVTIRTVKEIQEEKKDKKENSEAKLEAVEKKAAPEAPKREIKPEAKAEAAPEKKPDAKAEVKAAPPAAKQNVGEEKKDFNQDRRRDDRADGQRDNRDRRPQQNGNSQNANGQKYERQGDRPRNGFNNSERREGGYNNGDRRRDGQNNGQQRPYNQNGQRPNQGYGRYTAAPQDDPFAKRRDNMNRGANGMRPQGSQMPVQNARNQAQQAKAELEKRQNTVPAVNTTAGTLPAQKAQEEKLQRQKAQAEAQAQAKNQAPAKKDDKNEKKPAQKQTFKTITMDKSNVKGGVNIGVEYSAEAPKTRVVDMRTSDVDLSKYDDRYNSQYYAIANGTDTKAAKQKLKKQDNRGTNHKSAKDKERAAQEKIKKLEAERARNKQLEITVPDEIKVSELAMRLKKTSAEVVKQLMKMGEMKSVNDVIDFDTAFLVSEELGAKVTREIVITIEEKLFTEAEDTEADLVERAPVVCVMGHVDHGKTSILDAIRHTSVTKGEAGGITQAIGAYRVKANDKDITFLDTPGHEAFTAMRMRGAKSTDIAILVVAADDGVMPQTIEAINHAKAAGIDIIVAINKMDKPQANPDNVLNQLTQYELVPEQWGGDVICVPVSAHTGMGIDDLLESVLLVAEVKELRANPSRRARGLVIESKLDRGRGPVATVLVQNGTLHQGDYVIVGNAVGRVRAMIDDKGRSTKLAGPSVPVEIIGLDDVPQAGDELNAVEDERMARSLAEQRREKQRQEILNANARVNLDDLFSRISDGIKTLNIIVKADVAGSAEAVKASLIKLSNEEVKVNVIHSAVGGITESDVMLATASDAIITGFNVRPDKNALDSAERNGVDIRTHRIIYEIIDEVEAAMKGMLAPTFREKLLGHAEVRQTIRVPNVGTIAGCYITDGKIIRSAEIRIVRDGVVIFEDKISSLRRFKDDVKEVNEGYECGVGLDKFNDIKEGDILEAFVMEEVAR